ncbi:hypothetical protein GCM10010411_53270 [Actinomadura fulvescens]|uniref:Alpha/beta hydrolase domain-containing protein n=1 Tax=Actinomadura fulvescens TaxID=46160 RepID=A0ABN3Q534_9ACTN
MLVEWLNVTTGSDLATDFSYTFEELARRGYAYVGVDAQSAGITAPTTGLRAWNPARYGGLAHPGDEYSYDIFAQAGRTVREHPGLLGGRRVSSVLASGHSQSAMRLVTYLNTLSKADDVFDGYLVHSRGSFSAPIGGQRPPVPAYIRADLGAPVLNVQHEGDVAGPLNSHVARQPDSARFRLWEVAGGAHDDAYSLEFDGRIPRSYAPCTTPPNRGDSYQTVNAALSHLNSWAAGRTVPPRAPRLEINAAGTDVVRDSRGNAVGGIRLPFIEVPTASYNGLGNRECGGWYHGSSVPFDQATLDALYPSHGRYVAQVVHAAARATKQGFLLPADARITVREAAHSDVGR